MAIHKIKHLIIHCSDSAWGDFSAINEWHLARGWKGCGYNGVIPNGQITSAGEFQEAADGIFQKGRELDFDGYIDENEAGAHALGYNRDSVGVCMIGRDQFTSGQFRTLYHFCKVFQAIAPSIEILGHYQTERAGGKTCPNFDVPEFVRILDSADLDLDTMIKSSMPIKELT